MSIEIYWGSGSVPSWRAMLGFLAKGVPFEGRLINFSARDHKKPEFLALNPRGKVPTVVDGDTVIYESLAILPWLEARFPEPRLFGDAPDQTGQIWRNILEFDNYAEPIFDAVSRPILFQGAEGASLTEPLAAVVAELDRFHAALGGAEGRPLVGDRISAADLVWYPGLRFLERAATRPRGLALGPTPFGARWPGLLPWAARIEAIPGFETIFPPHWLTSDPPSALHLR